MGKAAESPKAKAESKYKIQAASSKLQAERQKAKVQRQIQNTATRFALRTEYTLKQESIPMNWDAFLIRCIALSLGL